MIDKEGIIKEIQLFRQKYNRTPRRGDLKEYFSFGTTRVNTLFGGWNRALEAAGVPINKRSRKEKLNKVCAWCGATCTINASQDRGQKHFFCSRSHATSFNNMKKPKRKKRQWKCVRCSKPVKSRLKYCDDCRPGIKETTTIGEFKKRNKHPYFAAITVRKLAREKVERLGWKKECTICGYDKVVDLSHVIPIKNFGDDTPIVVINAEHNLVYLCPNHHREYDRGLMSEADLEILNSRVSGTKL